MRDQEDEFENNTSTLGCFEKKGIDKNESENLSKERNISVGQLLITINENEHDDNGWNIVKKQNNRKANKKVKQIKKDSKTLAKFAKIPCRNYPGCKWKNECWYSHKEKRGIYPNCQKEDISRKQLTAKNTQVKACDKENRLNKAFPCQNIN